MADLLVLFRDAARDERYIRNWLARAKLEPVGENAAGRKVWSLPAIIAALDSKARTSPLEQAKLEGQQLKNELDRQKLANIQADVESRARAQALAEIQAVLDPVRRALEKVEHGRIRKLLDAITADGPGLAISADRPSGGLDPDQSVP